MNSPGAASLQHELNTLVPKRAGLWGNLVYMIGLQSGCELRLLGEVDEPGGDDHVCRLWAASPKEHHYFSLLLIEWWAAHDPSRDYCHGQPIPYRHYVVGDSSWLTPDRRYCEERIAWTNWDRPPWARGVA